MADTSDRLATCFQSVFPELSEPEIRQASMDSVANWDSLATVTLVSLIEEEYDIEIDPEDLEKLTSFSAIEAIIGKS